MRQNDYSNSTSVLERKESLFRFLIDFPFYKRKKRLLQQIMGIFLYLIYFISPSFNSEIHSDLISSPRNCLTSVSIRSDQPLSDLSQWSGRNVHSVFPQLATYRCLERFQTRILMNLQRENSTLFVYYICILSMTLWKKPLMLSISCQ